ncbi:MAG: CHRD domain-containing protein [Bacteroidia bacterium]|nr:CHRD domain-containing protein [Bacteroidia bacterium]
MVFSGIIVFASCDKQSLETGFQNVPDFANSGVEKLAPGQTDLNVGSKGQVVLNFRAHLTGDQEVPPRDTQATGEAVFQLSKDGLSLSYKIIVANLDNLTMSHIHVANEGFNGPVVAWLYPPSPPAVLKPNTTNGILQEGVLTKVNLSGSLAGKELSDLLALMTAHRTYVNVHTTKYPGGEIRGQIHGNVKDDL